MQNKHTKFSAILLSVLIILTTFQLQGCTSSSTESEDKLGNGWEIESSMELLYAENFSVDYYEGGYALITISDGSRYLVVPEDCDTPMGIDDDIIVLQQPIENIYLVATSAMCLFDALSSLDNISLSGTDADGWYVENAKKAMEDGDILYAGKYSQPDYELILANDCQLAIESTMINHSPDVKEKLETLGIPVLIEQSSFETNPLGRTEWIKLYAVLVDKEDVAESLFNEQVAYMESVSNLESTGKTVAYFYISSSGAAVTRKSGDYVSKMIELAGGVYIFSDLGDSESATSTVTLEMEEFYATAKDADYIIYNSTIDGGVSSLDELIAKNELLKDFKAVQNGNVWCTSQNLYQETTQLGLMIQDIHKMLTCGDDVTELNFLTKLQ
jgi:iron complex transport system substrate-binding protein